MIAFTARSLKSQQRGGAGKIGLRESEDVIGLGILFFLSVGECVAIVAADLCTDEYRR